MILHTIDMAKRLRVVRDDIYPFLGGGNKGRKMDYIGIDILSKKAKAIVTTGGIQSNHCRAVAVFSAQHKLKCTLVLHGDPVLFEKHSGNAKIMRESGADCVFVSHPQEISEAMDLAMAKYQGEGLSPYYLYGGGHTHEGGKAYVDAVFELKEYCLKNGWFPDYIFLASGTGSTQAGILAGLAKFDIPAYVVGISVGRKRHQAEAVVENFYKELCSKFGLSAKADVVTVLDDYLCDGYGKFNIDIKKVSEDSLATYGFALDTTYTAKAFHGMQDYIKRQYLESKNILFWHTGGVLNYLAE